MPPVIQRPVRKCSLTWDALFFDFDGVLADTEPVHFACWSEILAPLGITFTWDFYKANCTGVSDKLMVERFAAERVPPLALEEVWPEYNRKQMMFRRRLEKQSPFIPATLELVRSLNGSYKMAVVSSSGRSEVEPPLERAGIRGCFDILVCGREAEKLKPAPDPYLRAAALTSAKRPLVIEDSDTGVAAGVAAGFDVLRIVDAGGVAEAIRRKLGR